MSVNLLFIIAAAVLLAGAWRGWKRGLLEGLIRIISCILGVLVLVVVVKGIGSFMQGSIASVIIAVLLLAIIKLIHKLVKFLIGTFRLVRAIPVGRLADKLEGAALGAIEAVLILWLLFLLIGSFDWLNLNGWLMEQVSQNSFLTALYYSNYLAALLQQIL